MKQGSKDFCFFLNRDGGGVNGEGVDGKVEGGETGLICKINEKVI